MRLRFGDCVFDSDTRGGLPRRQRRALPPKVFQLLELLIVERPKAISKGALHDRICPIRSCRTRTSPIWSRTCARRSAMTRAAPHDPHGPALRVCVRGRCAPRGDSARRRRRSASCGPIADLARRGRERARPRPRGGRLDRRVQRVAAPREDRDLRRRRDARGPRQQERHLLTGRRGPAARLSRTGTRFGSGPRS